MNPWRGLSGLPRQHWILCGAVLTNRAGTMVLPFLVLYLTRSLGWPAHQAGLAVGIYGIGALLVGPVAGRLCDSLGAARVMEASLFISGGLLFLVPHARGIVPVMTLVFLWAVTAEAFRPASLTLATHLVAPGQRKAAIALLRLAINLGMSVGPAVGGFLAVVSFPAIFYVDGATSLLAGLVLARSSLGSTRRAAQPEPIDATAAPDAAAATSPPPRALLDRRLLFFLAALTPAMMVFFQWEAAMPLFLVRDLGFSESIYGLLFSINTGIIILLEVPLNLAMAHWPHGRTMAIGALLTGAGFGALGLASGSWTVVASVVIWTFGEMTLLPSSAAYVADIAPIPRRGAYMGLYTMTFSAAFALGPWLGTLTLDRFGAGPLWASCFVGGCLSALLMLRVRG